jgi:hypothetical protein
VLFRVWWHWSGVLLEREFITEKRLHERTDFWRGEFIREQCLLQNGVHWKGVFIIGQSLLDNVYFSEVFIKERV